MVDPTVNVSIDNSDVNVANPAGLVTFTFSQAPVGFTLADTAAIGGNVTNLLEVDPTTYIAMFTGSADTDTNNAVVSVTAGSWHDGNGNAGAGGTTAQFTVDTVVPTVNVSINNTVLNLAHPSALVTFTFNKVPVDFSLHDVIAADGSLSNLSGSGTSYTATYTANPGVYDNAATVSVIDGSYHDVDGNVGIGASTVTPVTFSSAVATFYEVQNNWAPSQMIDGLFTVPGLSTFGGVNGWSVMGVTGAQGADALLTLANPLPAGHYNLTFRLYQNYYGNPGHLLGDFALDYTTAASPTLSSPQTPVSIQGAFSDHGTTFSFLSPGELLANSSQNSKGTDTYTISAFVDSASPITGIFLDAIKNPALPGGGPGTFDNGNFVISEFTLDADTGGSTAPFTINTLAPSAPSITSVTDNVAPITGALANGASTNDPSPVVKVSLSDTGAVVGDTVQLYNGTDTSSPLGSAYALTATDISNGYANVQPGTLSNGNTYTLTARISDAASHQSPVSTNSFTLTEDTSAPTLSWTPGTEQGVQTGAISLGTLTASDSDGVSSLIISGATAAAILSDGVNSHKFSGPTDSFDIHTWNLSALKITPSSDANFELAAVATDTAGNASTAATEVVNVIPQAPVITAVAKQGNTWNLSGTANAGEKVNVYNGVTVLGTVTADGSGNWTLKKVGSTSAIDTFTAKVTDGDGDLSAASAAWMEGTSGNNTFTFNTEAALASATLFGNGGTDTLLMSAAATLTDADFANIHSVKDLQLSGASGVTLGADAASAGITTVITGSGATSIADSAGSSVSVNAAALPNNTVLTLSGSAPESVTGLIGDISASGLTGALTVATVHNNADHGIAITTGSATTSITDNFGSDTVTVNASALGDNSVLTLAGSAAENVIGLIGDISATGLSGQLTVTAAQNNVDHNLAIHTGSGTTSITDNFSTDTVIVFGTSGPDTIKMSGAANFVVTGAGGADTLTGGTGRNTYVYNAASDSAPSAHDTVTNFNITTDKIDFSAISGLNSNAQPVAISFLASTPSSIAPHTIDVVTTGGNTVIYADASAKSEAISNNHEDMQVNLTGVAMTSVDSADFILHH